MWWGAGYAIAQDRLFQIEAFRRATTGTLAEILGKGALEDDIIARRDFYTKDERMKMVESLPDDLRSRWQAYADGVNAWIDEVNSDPSKMPAEYAALGASPEPLEVHQMAAIGIFLARTTPSDDGEELANLEAFQAVGPKVFDRVLPATYAGPMGDGSSLGGPLPLASGPHAQAGAARVQAIVGLREGAASPRGRGVGVGLGRGAQVPARPRRLEDVGDAQARARVAAHGPAARLRDARAPRRARAPLPHPQRPRHDRGRRPDHRDRPQRARVVGRDQRPGRRGRPVRRGAGRRRGLPLPRQDGDDGMPRRDLHLPAAALRLPRAARPGGAGHEQRQPNRAPVPDRPRPGPGGRRGRGNRVRAQVRDLEARGRHDRRPGHGQPGAVDRGRRRRRGRADLEREPDGGRRPRQHRVLEPRPPPRPVEALGRAASVPRHRRCRVERPAPAGRTPAGDQPERRAGSPTGTTRRRSAPRTATARRRSARSAASTAASSSRGR